jgi:anthranilate synthase component 1
MPLRAHLRREVAATAAQLRWLATHRSGEFPLFLDSAARGEGRGAGNRAAELGRYSILFAPAEAMLLLRGDGRLEHSGSASGGENFLAAFDQWWDRERVHDVGTHEPGTHDVGAQDRLPFRGGWALYLAYELAAQIESGLAIPTLAADALCAVALRVCAAAIYDHQRERCELIAEPDAAGPLQGLQAAIAAVPATAVAAPPTGVAFSGAALIEQPEHHYRDIVLLAQQYIAAGDIYQANLSRGWQLQVSGGQDTSALYERLRSANPAPFAAFASLPGLTILSSSPERLVRVSDGGVETRPIAGTRPRSGAQGADAQEQSQLLANPKERAEHVMLIDLERNDLGRICQAGSVGVSEFMVTESYRHVHHIVSNVRGLLRPGVTPGQVLRAVFPGGTITGCPKYRCMQLIGELEGEPRGAYTGSLGYVNLDGSMDLNILIRTATLTGGTLGFRAGAGIVADSDWQRELAETRAKAQGMVRAFGGAS